MILKPPCDVLAIVKYLMISEQVFRSRDPLVSKCLDGRISTHKVCENRQNVEFGVSVGYLFVLAVEELADQHVQVVVFKKLLERRHEQVRARHLRAGGKRLSDCVCQMLPTLWLPLWGAE